MFKNLFSFKGRIHRLEFALSIVICVAIISVSILVSDFVLEYSERVNDLQIFISLLLSFYILLAQSSKRAHDIGKSGWIYTTVLLLFLGVSIPNFMLKMVDGIVYDGFIVGSILVYLVQLIILLVKAGIAGPNIYGADPKNPESIEPVNSERTIDEDDADFTVTIDSRNQDKPIASHNQEKTREETKKDQAPKAAVFNRKNVYKGVEILSNGIIYCVNEEKFPSSSAAKAYIDANC